LTLDGATLGVVVCNLEKMMHRSNNKAKVSVFLKQGDLLLGTLDMQDVDMFWWICTFTATSAFASIKPLFDEHAQLRKKAMTQGEKIANAERDARERIGALGLHLEIDGAKIRRFLIYIDGRDAGVRY
jgi:hypothetical protein